MGPALSPAGERRDAARNRGRLLQAALDLMAAAGTDALTMDALARCAGVGKGTVFRRFGSRAGLMQALLDHVERDFQQAYMSGPPPLGPGAPPLERLRAFGTARIGSLEVTGELARAADVDPAIHYVHPSRRLARAHLAHLLRETGSVADPELAAYQLAGFLDAGLQLHLRRHEGMQQERLLAGWDTLVTALTRP